MNVLVTGGRGFIGTELIDRMRQNKNFGVISCYDLVDKEDILDFDGLLSAFSSNKYDAIVHLAAKTSVEESHRIPEEYLKTNEMGTLKVVDGANISGIKKIIYAASAASLVPNSSPYALTKLNGERCLEKFDGQHLILRFFNVVGRRSNPSYSGVIDAFREGTKTGKITIYGDGNQTRDFIHIGDVCDALIASCLTNNCESACIDVGTGKETTINQLAKDIIAKSGRNVAIEYKEQRKEVRNSCANIENLKKVLGITPERPISEFYS